MPSIDTPLGPDSGRRRILAALQAALVVGAVGVAAADRRGRRAGLVAAATTSTVAVPYAAAVARLGPYESSGRGLARWLVDSTWSAPNTLAGAVFYLWERARGNAERPERCCGTGSIWLERPAIAGYATTIGIVKAGSSERIDAHEEVHVRQARLLGPLYLPLVALDFVLATVLPFWLWERDRPPITGIRDYFHRGVYRAVWHERWAYAVAPTDRRPPPVVDGAEWAQQDSNL